MFSVEENENADVRNYSRYWHGSLVLLKPLLMIGDIRVVKSILTVILCIVFGLNLYILYHKQYGQVAFLYNGKYGVASDDNGLYYMRTRYYNINIKRFINQDVVIGSIERSGSLNRYAYVEGNPISYIDPFGLDKQDSDENKETWERLESGFLYQSSEGHFRLKTELALLSRTVCLEVATEILMKGFIKDMNVIEVAAEIFAHAYLWYQTIFKDGIKDVPELEKVYKFLQKFDVVDLDDGGDARLGANEAYLALWFSALRVF